MMDDDYDQFNGTSGREVSMKQALFSLDDDYALDDDDAQFEDVEDDDEDDSDLFGHVPAPHERDNLMGGSALGGQLFQFPTHTPESSPPSSPKRVSEKKKVQDEGSPQKEQQTSSSLTNNGSSLPGITIPGISQKGLMAIPSNDTFYRDINDEPLNGKSAVEDISSPQDEPSSSSTAAASFHPLSSKSFQSVNIPPATTATLPWSKSKSQPPAKKSSVPLPKNDTPTKQPSKGRIEYVYGKVAVVNPVMMETGGLFGAAKGAYWTYEVRTEVNGDVMSVRRRFRNIVALEDRLRLSHPAVILPPRPEKTMTLPLEEGHLRQSHDFAKKRTKHLQNYFADLLRHPLIAGSSDLYSFLTFPDDLGHAWPECSSSALTRMNALGSSFINQKVTSGDAELKVSMIGQDVDDPDGELTTLMHNERVRMGKVHQAVPKFEGTLDGWKTWGEDTGLVGMEIFNAAKMMRDYDPIVASIFETMGAAVLKTSRRVKKMSFDLEEGGMYVMEREHRRAKNELAAFECRKKHIAKMMQKQIVANKALKKLEIGQMDIKARRASGLFLRTEDLKEVMREEVKKSDEEALQAMNEAEEIGRVLKEEIYRLGMWRRQDWSDCVMMVARDMMKCKQDQNAVWEKALRKLEKEGEKVVEERRGKNMEPDEI